ncbi:MAG: PepSY domain-containing protein [Bacteroidota bacterium]
MKETFRLSMLWAHTWAGLVLGSVLFAVFWMGSLSVFDKEIDTWMMPATRVEAPDVHSLDALAALVGRLTPDAQAWGAVLPTNRAPVVNLYAIGAEGTLHHHRVDLISGTVLPDPETLAGTGFIYPFHYSLHLNWKSIGVWIVGLAAMAMLLLLVSGVVIHARIFKDFFTLRPEKKLARSTLDLHNFSGVLVLPFHVLITLSGLVVYADVYFADAPGLTYPEEETPIEAYYEALFGAYTREAVGEPGTVGSLDAMARAAEGMWGDAPVDYFWVHQASDASAYVEMRRGSENEVRFGRSRLFFDGATGAVLHRWDPAPVASANRFLAGLHYIQFEHWALRWLYFVAGLAGCVLIGTGFVYWFEKRRAKHAEMSPLGLRTVEVLTVGSVTGILIATVAFFVVNRLLPLGTAFAGQERAALEVWAFYLVWLATFAHVALRRWRGASMRAVWREQTWALAGLAVVAPVLNGVTTGMHPVGAAAEGQWAVLGMDALLLATALLAVVVARRLGRVTPEAAPAAPKRPPAQPKPRPAPRPTTGPSTAPTQAPSGDGATEAPGVLGGDGATTGDETPAVAPPPVAQPDSEDRTEP